MFSVSVFSFSFNPQLSFLGESKSFVLRLFTPTTIETNMHLWPTKNLRDSFKLSYLKNLEWNYRRMEQQDQQQRQSSAAEQKLLENEDRDGEDTPKPLKRGEEASGVVASLCHELLLILSCCYCCFCCGACVEEK